MDDQELIKQTLEGKTEAFDLLVQEHWQTVYKQCLGIVKDEEIAQDLAQESFLQAFEHLDTFRMQARFSTWIWRIAHNRALNFLKKQHPIEYEFNEEIGPKLFPQEQEDGGDRGCDQQGQQKDQPEIGLAADDVVIDQHGQHQRQAHRQQGGPEPQIQRVPDGLLKNRIAYGAQIVGQAHEFGVAEAIPLGQTKIEGESDRKDREGDEEDYLNLIHFQTIALHNRDLMKKKFSLGHKDTSAKNKRVMWIKELNDIRNITHHGPKGVLHVDQVAFVKQVADMVDMHFP